MDESEQETVDYAFSKLSSADSACPKKIVKIEDFRQITRVGTDGYRKDLTEIDLVLGNREDNVSF